MLIFCPMSTALTFTVNLGTSTLSGFKGDISYNALDNNSSLLSTSG